MPQQLSRQPVDFRTILEGLRRSRQPNPRLSPSVYEEQPDLGLPFVAGPGENQAGLDFLHSRLGSGNQFSDLQRQQVMDTLERQRGAQLGGFESPQAEAQYGREFERYKTDVPVRAADVTGRYGVKQQEEQSRGGLAQQQEVSRGQLGVAQENQKGLGARYGALQSLLAGGQVPAGGSITMPGGGGIRLPQERQTPAAVANDVTHQRNLYETGKGSEEAVNSAIQMYLNARTDVPADVKLWTQGMARKYPTLSLDEILMRENEDQVTPNEHAVMQELLQTIRGR